MANKFFSEFPTGEQKEKKKMGPGPPKGVPSSSFDMTMKTPAYPGLPGPGGTGPWGNSDPEIPVYATGTIPGSGKKGKGSK